MHSQNHIKYVLQSLLLYEKYTNKDTAVHKETVTFHILYSGNEVLNLVHQLFISATKKEMQG